MKIGTKSLLFGSHQFLLHPFFVMLAWWRRYGFPWDPRLWIAFIVHDWGYWGCSNIDGISGKYHPHLGARLVGNLFGFKWYELCLYHSRFWAKLYHQPISRLCVADKLAFSMTPKWLYLPMVRLTGEIEEFMDNTPEAVRDHSEWYDFINQSAKKWETREANTNYDR